MNSSTNINHYLSNEQRLLIYNLYEKGYSFNSIKEEFRTLYGRVIYNTTIIDICDKVKATGSVETLPKSGRPLVYDEREKRGIIRASLKNRTQSIRDLTSDPIINPKRVSTETLRSLLSSNRVVSRILPRRMDDLTKDNIKKRKAFADRHLQWKTCDWELVIFSDEADLFLVKCGKEYIRLREEEKLVDIVPIRESAKKNLTIKVWDNITFRCRTTDQVL